MSTDVTALTTVIDAENAAIFAYGVATAFTSSASRSTVAEYIAAHRVARDRANAAILTVGGTEQVPAAGYTLPKPVDSAASAGAVLLDAEETLARAYRALLEQASTADLRRIGVDGLTASALRAAYWRGALKESPVTVALPGSAQR